MTIKQLIQEKLTAHEVNLINTLKKKIEHYIRLIINWI